MNTREQKRIAKHDVSRHRNRLDSIGRSNENKRGPKAEETVTQEQLDWARQLYNIRRANRQSDNYYN